MLRQLAILSLLLTALLLSAAEEDSALSFRLAGSFYYGLIPTNLASQDMASGPLLVRRWSASTLSWAHGTLICALGARRPRSQMMPVSGTGSKEGSTFDKPRGDCHTPREDAQPGMDEILQSPGPHIEGGGSTRPPSIEFPTLLAPIDFSPASRRGLAFAAGVAERFHSQLHLLYVVEPPSLPEWGYAHLAIKEVKLRREVEERLARFPLECGINPRLVRSTKVRSGNAEFEICRAADDGPIDLIVIASHGLGGFKQEFIGSTSAGVVRHAPCPVLTIREHAFTTENGQQPSFAPRRILVTTDFSTPSKKAFPYAVALTRKFDASLILVYVVPSHLPEELSHIGIIFEEQTMLGNARERLPELREVEIDPHIHLETVVLHGGPAHEICTMAATQSVDLIVIATHGHTGLRRLPLGSVAENVVRHAPCPVLVVRDGDHAPLKA